MKKILLLPLIIFSSYLTGCSTVSTPSEKYAAFSEAQVYQIAEVRLAKKNYRDSVEAYEALDSLYPFSVHAEQAQLDMIYAYYENDDMASTATAADRYIHLYPRSAHVDYAYYMRGLAHFNQDRGFFQRYIPTNESLRDPGTMSASYKDFTVLIQLFPNSPYAVDAKQRLVYLRHLFAETDVQVAEFYMKKTAYVAAINRANQVLISYADTPAAREALVLLHEAYQKLHMNDQAQKVEVLLKLNKP